MYNIYLRTVNAEVSLLHQSFCLQSMLRSACFISLFVCMQTKRLMKQADLSIDCSQVNIIHVLMVSEFSGAAAIDQTVRIRLDIL